MIDCPVKHGLIERILRGEASEEERYITRDHMQSPCPECEGTILGLPTESETTLVKLLISPKAGAASLSGKEKDDLFQSLDHMPAYSVAPDYDARPQRTISREKLRWYARAAAVALLVILPLAILRLGYLDFRAGEKDGETASRGGVFLQFLVFSEAEGRSDGSLVVRGDNNGQYFSDSSLLFRFQLDGPAWLYLVRSGGAGDGEVIFPLDDSALIEQPGFYDATSGADVLVYPLSGLTGSQTFCAVAYPPSLKRPGPDAASERALREIDSHRLRSGNNRLRHDWIDCFQIEVIEK